MKNGSIPFPVIAATLLAIGLSACSRNSKTDDAGTPETETVKNAATVRSDRKPRSRKFRLDYGFTLKGLPAGAKVRVWMPVPPSNRQQTVAELDRLLPASASIATEPTHGNRIMYLEPTSPATGVLKFRVSYRVTRLEVQALSSPGKPRPLSPRQRRIYLAANVNVPLKGKPIELLKGLTLKNDVLRLARQLYDRVDDHVTYDKSKPGYGRGDVIWVCDSRSGNCSDFHSLFISLARSRGIPARFEIGFPLPEKQGAGTVAGYHCWAYFYSDGRGWTPVDISEADKHPDMKDYYFGNLTENRVTFSTGRDLNLIPRQAAKPLNFFIYPHVEVNGKTWPEEKIEKQFAYENL